MKSRSFLLNCRELEPDGLLEEPTMPTTIDDLQDFYEFAAKAIAADKHVGSMLELVRKWRAMKERASVNEAIRISHAEFAAGDGRPADEFLAEMRAKHNLGPGS